LTREQPFSANHVLIKGLLKALKGNDMVIGLASKCHSALNLKYDQDNIVKLCYFSLIVHYLIAEIMPYTAEHKQQSRQRILDSAVRFFLQQGYDKTAIGEIMQDAGLTHGGFYAHFSNKGELYIEAMNHAAKNGRLTAHLKNGKQGEVWLEGVLEDYLSLDHAEGKEDPCPLAFLVTDIASRESDVRRAYTRIYKSINRFISRQTMDDPRKNSDDIYALTAMMIGGVAISRAIDDPKLAKRLLQSCRESASKLLSSD
jgi:AcrR family transcriptional regulator